MALAERHLIAIKSETTYGQDAFTGGEPTEWLAVLGDPEIQESYVIVESEEKTAVHSGRKDLRYGEKTEVSFTAPLLGKTSVAGDPPPMLDALFKACNLAETVNVDTDVLYKPITGANPADVPSMTVVHYQLDDETGEYYKRVITGVRGNITLQLSEDGDIRVQFSGMGLFSAPPTSTTALSANPTVYNGGKNRMSVQGSVFSYESTDYPMTSFELQTGWDVGEDKKSSSNAAVDQIYLYRSSRASGSTTLKGRSSVISTMLPAVQSGAEGQIEVAMSDGTDTITPTCPKVQIGAYSKSAQGGRYAFDLPLTFNGHWDGASEAGENEFQLQFS